MSHRNLIPWFLQGIRSALMQGFTACLYLAAAGIVLHPGCQLVYPRITPTPTDLPYLHGSLPEDIEVFFTRPLPPDLLVYRGGPDEPIVRSMMEAERTIEMAAYQMNLWSLRDALIGAHERGVLVRVVVESDNLLDSEVQELQVAGIPVVGDNRPSSMHHKFLLLDGRELWTGSMNFTVTGAYRNNNNLIHLNFQPAVDAYREEFEEMFHDREFGTLSEPNSPKTLQTPGGMRMEVLFSPEDGVEGRLVDLIQQARHQVLFMAYSLTSDPIAEALQASHQRGVEVRGVIERRQANNAGSDLGRLLSSGIQVREDGNSRNMHHKVMILDGEIVITGSYNFSRSAAEKNDENLIILYNRELALLYLQEFSYIWDLALPP